MKKINKWTIFTVCWSVWDFAVNNKQNCSHHSWYSTILGNDIIIDGFKGTKNFLLDFILVYFYLSYHLFSKNVYLYQ